MKPDELRALVAVMRELGVIEADGVRLGPVPAPAHAPRKRPTEREQEDLDAERAAKLLFASTRVRPLKGIMRGSE